MSEQKLPASRFSAPPLPATVEGLIAQRRSPASKTLNDHVEELHLKLWADADYRKALEAVYDEEAVEGSIAADNFVASQMIRARAKDDGNTFVESRKLHTITRALKVVMRRYHISRNERALMIGGRVVKNDDDDGNNGDNN